MHVNFTLNYETIGQGCFRKRRKTEACWSIKTHINSRINNKKIH